MGKNRQDRSDSSGADLNGPHDGPDQDGLTNWEEYLKGSDPLSKASNK